MIVGHFLSWAQTATAVRRSEAAGALARAYLYAGLDADARRKTEVALTSLLDDPSPLVRRALAESFADATDAPRAIISALACDQSDIAAPILLRSPLLSEAELLDCAAIGDAFARSAIALRANVPASVCAALAETGARETAISLLVNTGADVPEFSLRRLIERFGDDGEFREALLSRPSLPATVRNDLVMAAATRLTTFVVDCGWLSAERAGRLAQETRDRANVMIVADAARRDDHQGVADLVAHLRASQQLTASLILRALLSGERALFEAALIELSQLRAERVAGLLRNFNGAGFAALYARAGLPEALLPAFRAALTAQREFTDLHPDTGSARLSLEMIERVIAVCGEINDGELDRLVALLRRFELEAALEQARIEARRIAQRTPTPKPQAPTRFDRIAPRGPIIDIRAFEARMLRAA